MDSPHVILATAYAVNPYQGSEAGMGWNFILQMARFNRVIAITRENNRPAIEKYMDAHPDHRYRSITFLYFDLPRWARWWKKGGRGALLYFLLWQRALPAYIKKRQLQVDIVHNLNFHNDWTPSFLWKLKKPFVWGPIGHHPAIPSDFLKGYRLSYLFRDRAAMVVKYFFWRISPALQNTIRHASHILCMNSTVTKAINLTAAPHSLMPSVAAEDHGFTMEKSHTAFTLISVGRLVPLKGFDLTIRAFAQFVQDCPAAAEKKCKLIIVGSGPEKMRLQALAEKQGVAHQVEFQDWMERAQLVIRYQQASAFIFPSHEGAGMVVAEAMSFGLPVICLDNAGPGEFIDKDSGIAVAARTPAEAIRGLAAAIERLYTHPAYLNSLRSGARRRFEHHFHWDRRGEELREIYKKVSL